MDFIESMTEFQLNDMLRTVGIYERLGDRVKFLCEFFDFKIYEEAWNNKSIRS